MNPREADAPDSALPVSDLFGDRNPAVEDLVGPFRHGLSAAPATIGKASERTARTARFEPRRRFHFRDRPSIRTPAR